jgi:hypothetical protein
MTIARRDLAHVLTVDAVVATIGHPPHVWRGNCYAIACQMLDAGLVDGVARYGKWLGPVAPGSYFARHPLPSHGWLEVADPDDDVYIVDPTRWVFEDGEPYIWIGHDHEGYYDRGGNRVRAAYLGPPPTYDPDKPEIALRLGDQIRAVVAAILGDDDPLTSDRLFWLANLDPADFGPYVDEIYRALDRAGWKAAIPQDNWMLVIEPRKRKKS